MKNGRSSIQEEQPRNNQGLFKTHVFQVLEISCYIKLFIVLDSNSCKEHLSLFIYSPFSGDLACCY